MSNCTCKKPEVLETIKRVVLDMTDAPDNITPHIAPCDKKDCKAYAQIINSLSNHFEKQIKHNSHMLKNFNSITKNETSDRDDSSCLVLEGADENDFRYPVADGPRPEATIPDESGPNRFREFMEEYNPSSGSSGTKFIYNRVQQNDRTSNSNVSTSLDLSRISRSKKRRRRNPHTSRTHHSECSTVVQEIETQDPEDQFPSPPPSSRTNLSRTQSKTQSRIPGVPGWPSFGAPAAPMMAQHIRSVPVHNVPVQHAPVHNVPVQHTPYSVGGMTPFMFGSAVQPQPLNPFSGFDGFYSPYSQLGHF